MSSVCEYHHCNKIAEYRYTLLNKYNQSTTVEYCTYHAETHADAGGSHSNKEAITNE